ncbi:MAG: 5'-nucleotidase [Spirochaetia bacterium]|nr:5'-nucleotidase [Spirochaetia bacterium]
MRTRLFSIAVTLILVLSFVALPVFAQEGLDTVIGETEISLNGERQHVRTQETNLGNLVCDIIRENTGADIALYNGGGIRDSADLGEITLETAMAILAFDNEVVTLEMTGQQIWDALEHGLHGYPEVVGGFLQVSGLRFYFDPSKEPYNRVGKVLVGGSGISLNKTYTVATNGFIASGGDDFSMMGEAKQLKTFELTDQKMFIRYIQENSPLFPMVKGRTCSSTRLNIAFITLSECCAGGDLCVVPCKTFYSHRCI